MKHELLHPLMAAIFALLIVLIEDFLPFEYHVNLVICFFAALVLFILANVVFSYVKRFKFARIFDPLSDFEGYWLDVWDHAQWGRCYSVSKVDFDADQEKHVLKGNNYVSSGQPVGDWDSLQIFHRNPGEIFYASQGTFYGHSGSYYSLTRVNLHAASRDWATSMFVTELPNEKALACTTMILKLHRADIHRMKELGSWEAWVRDFHKNTGEKLSVPLVTTC